VRPDKKGGLACRGNVKNVTLFPANEQVITSVKVMGSEGSFASQCRAWLSSGAELCLWLPKISLSAVQSRQDDALLFFDEAGPDAIPVDEGDEEWMW
jgi:hypothetical protein